jgi:ATP-dependent DNA ligase
MLLIVGQSPTVRLGALELKWDGCRAQLRYDGRSVTLRRRECSADFPDLSEIAGVLGRHRATLNGELLCARDNGPVGVESNMAGSGDSWKAVADIHRNCAY